MFVLQSHRIVGEEVRSESDGDFHLSYVDSDGDADLLLVLDVTSFRYWTGLSGFGSLRAQMSRLIQAGTSDCDQLNHD